MGVLVVAVFGFVFDADAIFYVDPFIAAGVVFAASGLSGYITSGC